MSEDKAEEKKIDTTSKMKELLEKKNNSNKDKANNSKYGNASNTGVGNYQAVVGNTRARQKKV